MNRSVAGPAWRGAAVSLLVFVFAVTVYRAATQSITADEAFTYNHYAGGDVPLDYYHANNHVLFTLLAKGSVSLLGLSELTFRLPALAGALLFLAVIYGLSRRAFGDSWLLPFAAAALALNPFVLDFLSAARGYGLALAFLFWSLYEMTRGRLPSAGAALGLSVAANLNCTFPGAALAAVFLAMLAVEKKLRRGLWRFCLPGLAVSAAILAAPLRTAHRDSFYAGGDSLRTTLDGLLVHSFFHGEPWIDTPLGAWLRAAAHWFVPAVFVITLALAVMVARSGSFRKSEAGRVLLLAGGTLVLTLALLAAAHYLLGVQYPEERMALYWIPLFTLVCLATMAVLTGRLWLAAAPYVVFLALAIVQYALLFDTRFYSEWRYDAGTRRIVNMIREREAAAPHEKLRIGASWQLEPSLNFYRQMFRLNWENVTRAGPDGEYDYYVLHSEETQFAEQKGLERLYWEPVSGAVLAAPRARR